MGLHQFIGWKFRSNGRNCCPLNCVVYNLFTTSEPPKYSNSPNLFLWCFCLIKSRANCSQFKQHFLNRNLIFFSNASQIFCCRIIKKNQNKDLENLNSNILEVPMLRTSYWCLQISRKANQIFDRFLFSFIGQ